MCLLQLEAHDRMRSASNAAERHAVDAKRPPGLRSRSRGPRADGEVCEVGDFLPLK